MQKYIYATSIVILACGMVALWWPKATGQSKSSQKSLKELTLAHKAEAVREDQLWKPVATAIAAGDVYRTHAAVAAYLSAGGQLGRSRIELGRFYLAKGDLVDAKSELDHVVDPFDPLVNTNARKRARTMSAHDAEALCLWQAAAVNAPESEKQAVLARWYANYNFYGHKPGILDEYKVTPEALTELLAGQWCMGSKTTYAEAVEHYRKAVALAPASLRAVKQLEMGLRFNGEMQEAKKVAVRAWSMSDNAGERQGILWGAHLTLDEAKMIAGAGKP